MNNIEVARNLQFPGFGRRENNLWQGNFFFIQAADTQFGLIDDWAGNPVERRTWDEEIRLTRLAIQHANNMVPKPKFFIVCGDLVNAFPEKVHRDAQEKDFKEIFKELNPQVPLVCVCGNHDVGNTPTSSTLSSYRRNFGDDYFSFWVQGVFFIVLNSQLYSDPSEVEDEFEKQDKWLDEQLEIAASEQCHHCVVFQHIPWFINKADEEKEYFNIDPVTRARMLAKLKKAGIRYIFCGHYHRNVVSFDGELEQVITSAIGCQLGDDLSGMRVVRISKEKIEHKYYALEQGFPHAVNLDENTELP